MSRYKTKPEPRDWYHSPLRRPHLGPDKPQSLRRDRAKFAASVVSKYRADLLTERERRLGHIATSRSVRSERLTKRAEARMQAIAAFAKGNTLAETKLKFGATENMVATACTFFGAVE